MPRNFDWIVGIFLVGLLLFLTGTETGHGEFVAMSGICVLVTLVLVLLSFVRFRR